MIINHKVKIDLVRQGIAPKIHVVQGDAHTRQVSIELFADRKPWTIPKNTVAVIRYLKPDRTSGTYDTLGDGTDAVSFSANTLSVIIAPEVLTLAGDVSFVVTLISGEQRLSTFKVDIMVEQNCSSSLSVETDTAWVAGFLPSPESAAVGQYFVVEQVDESGHVVAVKAAELPNIGDSIYEFAVENGYSGTEEEFAQQLSKGGMEEVIISSAEPANENAKIWINPEEEEASYVKSINGIAPDENGNVEVAGVDIDVAAEVGQTIIVKAVDETGKPTAWEAVHYQPRTHWVDGGNTVLEETMLIHNENDEYLILDYFPIEIGQAYTVIWNGVEYSCEAIGFQDEGDETAMPVLGNITGETGEPFIIIAMPSQEAFEANGIGGQVIPMEAFAEVAFSIIRKETLHKIEEKFLPDTSCTITIDSVYSEGTAAADTVVAYPSGDATGILEALKANRTVYLDISGYRGMQTKLTVTSWRMLGDDLTVDAWLNSGTAAQAMFWLYATEGFAGSTYARFWCVGFNVTD